MTWTVQLEPHDSNDDGRNESGLLIFLVNEDLHERKEIDAVGFVRRHTSHPATSFKAQLKASLETAEAAAGALNDAHKAIEDAKLAAQDAVANTPVRVPGTAGS